MQSIAAVRLFTYKIFGYDCPHKVLVHQLSNCVFSYWRIVLATCPIAWFFMDWCAEWPYDAPKFLCKAGAYWLFLLPSSSLIMLRLTYMTRRLCEGFLALLVLSMCLVLCWVPVFGSFMVLSERILPALLGDELSPLLLSFVMGILNLFLWRCLPVVRSSHVPSTGGMESAATAGQCKSRGMVHIFTVGMGYVHAPFLK